MNDVSFCPFTSPPELECPICFEEFKTNQDVFFHPTVNPSVYHVFCKNCYRGWQETCPMGCGTNRSDFFVHRIPPPKPIPNLPFNSLFNSNVHVNYHETFGKVSKWIVLERPNGFALAQERLNSMCFVSSDQMLDALDDCVYLINPDSGEKITPNKEGWPKEVREGLFNYMLDQGEILGGILTRIGQAAFTSHSSLRKFFDKSFVNPTADSPVATLNRFRYTYDDELPKELIGDTERESLYALSKQRWVTPEEIVHALGSWLPASIPIENHVAAMHYAMFQKSKIMSSWRVNINNEVWFNRNTERSNYDRRDHLYITGPALLEFCDELFLPPAGIKESSNWS